MRELPDAPDPVGAIALLGEPTRRRLYELVLASDEPVGRDEAASATEISRELAAFHLDRLVAGGLLVAEYKRLSGRTGPGAGRPAKLYRRTDVELAVSFPRRDYDRAADILAGALRRLDDDSEASGRGAVADVARARGRDDGAGARRGAGARPDHKRLQTALLDLLRRSGYAPVIAERSGHIRLHNCPYHALTLSHRDLTCGMNLAWARGVLEGLGDAEVTAEYAPGDGYCCVVFHGAASDREPTEMSQVAPAEPED